MADYIELEVRGPARREVTVGIAARERQGPVELEEADGREAIAKESRHHFGEAVLASRDALMAFLGRITRPVDDGGTVGGWIYKNRVSALLDLLDVTGMPSNPVPVELPSDD